MLKQSARWLGVGAQCRWRGRPDDVEKIRRAGSAFTWSKGLRHLSLKLASTGQVVDYS